MLKFRGAQRSENTPDVPSAEQKIGLVRLRSQRPRQNCGTWLQLNKSASRIQFFCFLIIYELKAYNLYTSLLRDTFYTYTLARSVVFAWASLTLSSRSVVNRS